MRTRWPLIAVMVASLAGFFFASFSTSDFAEHLDRQVHSIHCSFVPGLASEDASGSSGCHVTMMSPYSSVLRSTFWGGIPVSLPAMSVFAFLVFFAAALLVLRREQDPRATGFLALATLLPLLVSIAMAVLSIVTLGAACKLCIGIYAASILAFVFAIVQWRTAAGHRAAQRSTLPARAPGSAPAPADGRPAQPANQAPPPVHDDVPVSRLLFAFAFGVILVVIPVVAWIVALPNYEPVVAGCGELPEPEVPLDVRVPLDARAEGRGEPGAAEAIEVLDPLCPACRAFEDRLAASGLDDRMARVAVLFPLDNRCNWMVDEAVHAGACTISEAVLCAEDDAGAVLEWAFEEQEAIRTAAARDPAAPERMVREKFPRLARCVGSPAVRARLNRGLRWAVQNRLPVLTPQLYVRGEKLCDEDTDLGMDYALSRMLGGGGG